MKLLSNLENCIAISTDVLSVLANLGYAFVCDVTHFTGIPDHNCTFIIIFRAMYTGDDWFYFI